MSVKISWIDRYVVFSDRGQTVAGLSQPSTQLPANVATTTDLENLKKELTSIMRSEIMAAKHDILDGNSDMPVFTSFV